VLLPSTGLDADRRGSGLASSIVAIRLHVGGELTSQIRGNGDVVPRDASIRP
jgi:hypothetical protein